MQPQLNFGLPQTSGQSAQLSPQKGSPIGPSKPGYVQGTADTVPYNNVLQYNNYLNSLNNQGVLGASTGTTTPSSTGGGNQAPKQNAPAPQSNIDPHINPSTGQWDDNYYASHQGSKNADQVAAQKAAADAAFNPIIDYFKNLGGTVLPQQQQGQLQSVQEQYGNLRGLLPQEQTKLLSPIQKQQQQFNYDTQSALGQAQIAAANLQQQAQSQFGGGSSAGGAISNLAAAEYARQQAAIYQQQFQGQQGFEQNTNNVNLFIAQKSTDLDNWYKQTNQQIKDMFTQQINQANFQVGITEAEREAQKMDILGTAQQFQNQLELQHQQNVNSLALFKQAAEGIGGQQMNPSLMNNIIYQGMNSQVPQVATRGNQQASNMIGNLSGQLYKNDQNQQGVNYTAPMAGNFYGNQGQVPTR